MMIRKIILFIFLIAFTLSCESWYPITVSGSNFTVTFNSQGGTIVSPQTVISGGLLIAPHNPERSNYTFSGWHKETECTTAWNFTTDTVTADMTLYAEWIDNNNTATYTVTFNSQGGTSVSSKTVASGGLISEPKSNAK